MAYTRYHIVYSAEEDRIFVFVREGAQVEHAFGISRRLTKRMWPKMLKAFPEAHARLEKVPAFYQNEVRKPAHEGTVSKAKETGALAPERLTEVAERHDYLSKAVRITRRSSTCRSPLAITSCSARPSIQWSARPTGTSPCTTPGRGRSHPRPSRAKASLRYAIERAHPA